MKPATAVLIAVIITSPAHGQAPLLTQRLDSGVVVRLHLMNGDVTRGRLLAPFARDSERVLFCYYPRTPCQSRLEPAARNLPVDAIRRMEVARGNRAGRGAAIGSVLGLVLANMAARLANDLAEQERVDVGAATVSGALGGALWGALIGSMFTVWRPAP